MGWFCRRFRGGSSGGGGSITAGWARGVGACVPPAYAVEPPWPEWFWWKQYGVCLLRHPTGVCKRPCCPEAFSRVTRLGGGGGDGGGGGGGGGGGRLMVLSSQRFPHIHGVRVYYIEHLIGDWRGARTHKDGIAWWRFVFIHTSCCFFRQER